MKTASEEDGAGLLGLIGPDVRDDCLPKLTRLIVSVRNSTPPSKILAVVSKQAPSQKNLS